TRGYGERNRIFTKELVERSRQSLRRKLDPNRLSGGIDPTALPDLLAIAGYHLEAGYIKFADWSVRMVDHLGDWVMPHLPELYDGAIQTLYWRSRRPGFTPYEAESLRAVLETLNAHPSDTLADPAENGAKSPWTDLPSLAETNDVGKAHADHGGGATSGTGD